MPTNLIPGFIKRLKAVEDAAIDSNKIIVEMRTDIKWFKWILCGMAGLGFIEKLIGWVVK